MDAVCSPLAWISARRMGDFRFCSLSRHRLLIRHSPAWQPPWLRNSKVGSIFVKSDIFRSLFTGSGSNFATLKISSPFFFLLFIFNILMLQMLHPVKYPQTWKHFLHYTGCLKNVPLGWIYSALWLLPYVMLRVISRRLCWLLCRSSQECLCRCSLSPLESPDDGRFTRLGCIWGIQGGQTHT